MQPFPQQLQILGHKMVPAALTFIMVLLSAVPWHIPGLRALMPLFAFINIYYWGIFSPGTLPYIFLFLLGLIQDTLMGLPLGTSSFINIIFAFMMGIQRRFFGKTLFATIWIGFSTLSGAAIVLQWLMLSIYYTRLLPVQGPLLQWMSTLLAYPVLHILLTRVYKLWARP